MKCKFIWSTRVGVPRTEGDSWVASGLRWTCTWTRAAHSLTLWCYLSHQLFQACVFSVVRKKYSHQLQKLIGELNKTMCVRKADCNRGCVSYAVWFWNSCPQILLSLPFSTLQPLPCGKSNWGWVLSFYFKNLCTFLSLETRSAIVSIYPGWPTR